MKCDLEYGIWGECFEKWLAKIWKVLILKQKENSKKLDVNVEPYNIGSRLLKIG